MTPGFALARVTAAGVPAVRLDGEAAAVMLSAIDGIGEPTHYAAPTLVLMLLPDHVTVGLFAACHQEDVVLSPEGFRIAYERMRAGRARPCPSSTNA